MRRALPFVSLPSPIVAQKKSDINQPSDCLIDWPASTHKQQNTEHFALTPAELKTIILEGVKRSFFGGPYLQKRAYVKRFLHYYEVRSL